MRFFLPKILVVFARTVIAINSFVNPPSPGTLPIPTYYAGQTLNVQWTTDLSGVLDLDIWHSGIGGNYSATLIKHDIPNSQTSFIWAIPFSLIPLNSSDIFQLNIYNKTDGGFRSAGFSIASPDTTTTSSSQLTLQPTTTTVMVTVITTPAVVSLFPLQTAFAGSTTAGRSNQGTISFTPSSQTTGTMSTSSSIPSLPSSSFTTLVSIEGTISSAQSSQLSGAVSVSASSSISPSSSSSADQASGMSSTVKIGIGLGVPFAILALGFTVFSAVLVLNRRRRRVFEESQFTTIATNSPIEKLAEWRSELPSDCVVPFRPLNA